MSASPSFGRRIVLGLLSVTAFLVGCSDTTEDVAAGVDDEGCSSSAANDFFAEPAPGEVWSDHFPDEAGAIEHLIRTTGEPLVGILGPVEPTEQERRITQARQEAYAELERDDDRSTDERAVWVGPHAEVVLGRVEQGWRVEVESADLPPDVCAELRAERSQRVGEG